MFQKRMKFPTVVVAAAALLACLAPSPARAVNPLINKGSSDSNGSFFCLGIAGGSAADGAHAVQGPCTYDATQTWTSVNPVVSGGTYYTQIRNGNGKCLGLAGGSTAGGTHVVQGPCVDPTTDFSQSWAMDDAWTSDGQAVTRWRNRKSPGPCMGIAGGSSSSGAHVVIGTCGDDASNTRRWWSPTP